jgi:HEPN domain-containing protein
MLEEAQAKLDEAKNLFKQKNYSLALYNAFLSMKSSLETFLNTLKIEFNENNIDEKIYNALEKISSLSQDWEIEMIKKDLARVKIFYKLLKEISNIYLKEDERFRIEPNEIFDSIFNQFIEEILKIVEYMNNLLSLYIVKFSTEK